MILLATSLLLAVTRIADIRPALERSGKTVDFFEIEGSETKFDRWIEKKIGMERFEKSCRIL